MYVLSTIYVENIPALVNIQEDRHDMSP